MSLRGRIAIVSGASRGVGRGIALQLAQAGCTVYITGRPPSESLSASIALPTLENTALEISQRAGIGIVRYVDHGDMKSVEEFFKSIDEETGGRLDILINNAFSGVPRDGSRLENMRALRGGPSGRYKRE